MSQVYPHGRRTGLSLNRQVIKLLETHKAVIPPQVHYLFYRTRKTGKRLAQMKLKELYEDKKNTGVSRIRSHWDEPYIYFLDKRGGQFEHLIAVNWVYVWFATQLGAGQQITHWRRELNYKFLRPDALIGIRNIDTDTTEYWFVEFDRAESLNPWDKVEKYTQLYENRNRQEGFPGIFCVTTKPSRVKEIKNLIAEENRLNLKFVVRLLDDIIKEAKP